MSVFRALTFLLPAALCAQHADLHEFFEKKIRPVLVENCQGCHNAKLKTAELDLGSGEGFAQGGQSGAIVSKDNPGKSLLLSVLSYDERMKMPPTGKLKAEELADLTTWVHAGAPWPGAVASPKSASSPSTQSREFTEEEKKFWSFQPVRKAAPPAVKNKNWVQSPVDRFILAKLEERGLKPAPGTSKVALLRRVSFDLTGLPPSEEEIQSFLSDPSPEAFSKVVDRLLASPRYGEKWGRHWLDVARYADSTGNDEDHRYPYAWRYRDYVIEAFNNDLPYDHFIREQIAGDLLPSDRPSEPNRRGIVAAGFLALGAKAIAQQDKKKMLYDVYDEQVDVTTKTLMGVTVACARCHDHKFDPILTKDYYSLISIFASTRSFKDAESHVSSLLFTPLVPKEEFERYTEHKRKVSVKNMEIEDLTDEQIDSYRSQLIPHLAQYMLAARRVYSESADIAAAAKEKNLREDVLKKWVKYLKPNGEAQVHLDEWRGASEDRASEVARLYQERFEKQDADWSKRMAKWRATFKRMVAEMNMPPPDRPKFDASKDRFFSEVYFQGPFGVTKADREKLIPQEANATLAKLRLELEQLKSTMPPEPDMACAVEEGEVVQQKVFIRGDYNSPGPDAPKAFPLIIAGHDQQPAAKGSGRLEFANWLTKPDHPLTPRVMANRIWYWHFGEGLVRTPDNFGKMGERPTHPELLDYLASRFVESGWSIKAMHRLILLSSAYQMSTEMSDAAMQSDPENRLLSRFPRRRLAVEEVRDGLLAMDGSLDITMGGTLQKGFGTDQENSNDRLSIRPETNKRRMVYLPLRRANLPTMLNLFDFGDATTASGRRNQTTVAPQALFMMNSEFVAERARNLASAVMKEGEAASRIRRLYLKILSREPAADEIDAGLTYVSQLRKKRPEADAWFSFSRVLIGSNEFIYVD